MAFSNSSINLHIQRHPTLHPSSPSSAPYRLISMADNENARQNKRKKRNSITTAPARCREKRPNESETTPIARRKKPIKDEDEEGAVSIPDIEDFGEDETLRIRGSLLQWYDRNGRDLPWRRTTSLDGDDNGDSGMGEEEDGSDRRAYAVWVSEVMLQQTRVQTVVAYFNRWMLKWPTLHSLSKASLEEVNEMWAGLGYYRRARFLLEGARMLVEGGVGFPRTVAALCKVRGIGDYTAGAIASIAFDQVVPVVDGNVIRVLARLKAVSANPKQSLTMKRFWKLAGQLVDPCRPGDFNQALMELGATVCTPLSPSCSTCPLATQCQALAVFKQNDSHLVTDYPVKVLKAKQRLDYSAVCVVEVLEGHNMLEGSQSESCFLLVKRPDKGLLAGLWEFPSVLLNGEADLPTRRKAIDIFLENSFNLHPKKTCSIASREDIGEYVHVFSHIRLKMYVELLVLHLKGEMDVLRGKLKEETITWKCVDSKALASMGLTSGIKKVCNMIQEFKKNGVPPIPIPAKRRKEKAPRK